jgi:hypothetical protein
MLDHGQNDPFSTKIMKERLEEEMRSNKPMGVGSWTRNTMYAKRKSSCAAWDGPW